MESIRAEKAFLYNTLKKINAVKNFKNIFYDILLQIKANVLPKKLEKLEKIKKIKKIKKNKKN